MLLCLAPKQQPQPEVSPGQLRCGHHGHFGAARKAGPQGADQKKNKSSSQSSLFVAPSPRHVQELHLRAKPETEESLRDPATRKTGTETSARALQRLWCMAPALQHRPLLEALVAERRPQGPPSSFDLLKLTADRNSEMSHVHSIPALLTLLSVLTRA